MPPTGTKRFPFPERFVAAHRGSVGGGARENTLASFEQAIARGADAIELDVRRLADDVLVVFHDAGIEGRPLRTLTTDDVARFVSDRLVPTFAEVAETLAGRVCLDVELKERGTERAAIDTLIHAGWTPAQFVVTSFDIETLDEVRRLCPDAVIGWLTETECDAAIRHVTAGRVDFAAPHERVLSATALDAFHSADVTVVPWTVNEPERLATLFPSPAVLGIITDRVSLALQIR